MINYNFFGKDCLIDADLQDRTDLNQKLNDLNFKFGEVLLLNQVHGDKVVLIDDIKKIHGTQNLPKADGIVTNLKNVAIGIVTADCAPIIFYDEEKRLRAELQDLKPNNNLHLFFQKVQIHIL